jgi:hypothetical protein
MQPVCCMTYDSSANVIYFIHIMYVFNQSISSQSSHQEPKFSTKYAQNAFGGWGFAPDCDLSHLQYTESTCSMSCRKRGRGLWGRRM